MRGRNFWRPMLGVLVAFAMTMTAYGSVGVAKKPKAVIEGDGASGLPGGAGPEITTMSPANNCTAPLAGGVLPAAGGVLSGDTYLAGNDFEDPLGNCSYSAAISNNDEIWEFQVEQNGVWSFDTCTIPAGWDTSLAVYDGFVFCPGVPMKCDGDGCNVGAFESLLELFLVSGRTYYLVVDGWSPTSYYGFLGDFYDVTFIQKVPPCTSDGDCDDGDDCNGVEECLASGECVSGPVPCPIWAVCNPVTQACDNPWDPCQTYVVPGDAGGSFSAQNFNGCVGSKAADDVALSYHAGRELISYQTMSQARNLSGSPTCAPDPCGNEPNGSPYSVTVELYDVVSDVLTSAAGPGCIPQAPIVGTQCVCTDVGLVAPAGTGGDICLCEPNGGLPTGIILPTATDAPDTSVAASTCGADLYMTFISHNDGGGVSIASNADPSHPGNIIGGPGLADDFGINIFMFENCSGPGAPDGTWSAGAFGAPSITDFRKGEVCTVPAGKCCFSAGGCTITDATDCANQGGTYGGDNTLESTQACSDADGDGVDDLCDNCPNTPNPAQSDCNNDGEGNACDPDAGEVDSDGDGVCDNDDGCPGDPGKSTPGNGLGEAPGQCGCDNPDDDGDGDGTADCIDGCPTDPNKITPGVCGCNSTPQDDADDDGDGFLNCVDQCAGADDAVFAPGCVGAIPTVSEWGLVVMALLLLVAGKVYFGRRSATA